MNTSLLLFDTRLQVLGSVSVLAIGYTCVIKIWIHYSNHTPLFYFIFCNLVLYLYTSVLDCASSVRSIVLGFVASRVSFVLPIQVVFCLYLVRFYVPNGLLNSFYLILIHLGYRRVICIPFYYKKMKKKNKLIHFSNTMFGRERNIKRSGKWRNLYYI